MTDLKTRFELIKNKITDLLLLRDELQSEITSFKERIKELQSDLKNRKVEIVKLKEELAKLLESTNVKSKDRAAAGLRVEGLRNKITRLEEENNKVAARIETLETEKAAYESFIRELYKLLGLGEVKPTTGGVVTQGNTTSFGKKMNFEKSWALYKLVHDKKLNNSLKKLARK